MRIVKLSKDKIIGQSTFGMKETDGKEFEELQIKDASKAVSNVLRKLINKKEVDLLHVNCEVTSFYETRLKQVKFHSSVKLIQLLW